MQRQRKESFYKPILTLLYLTCNILEGQGVVFVEEILKLSEKLLALSKAKRPCCKTGFYVIES